jgi:hypothetical protein
VDGPDSSQRRQKSELRTQLLARNLIFMDGNAIRVTLAHA